MSNIKDRKFVYKNDDSIGFRVLRIVICVGFARPFMGTMLSRLMMIILPGSVLLWKFRKILNDGRLMKIGQEEHF